MTVPAIGVAAHALMCAAHDYVLEEKFIGDELRLRALEYGVRVLLDLKLLDSDAFRQQLLEVAGDVLRVARERPGSLP